MALEDDRRYMTDQRIDRATDETLATTRRILQVTEETHHVGVDTLITIHDQGEQLDNVEQRLDEMNVDMKRGDKAVKELEKCCGCCVCTRSAIKATKYRRLYNEADRQRPSVVTEQPTAGGRQGRQQPQGPFIKKVTNDVREDEMEDNLQAVSGVLAQLKGMAVDMGDEMDRQSSQLDRIKTKTEVNDAHLSYSNYRIKRQL